MIALTLSITIIFGISTIPASASTTTPNITEISLGSVTGVLGDTRTIPITISNNKGISTFDFIITYDSKRLEPISVTRGNNWLGSFVSNLKAGTVDNKYIRVVGASLNNYSVNETILSVTFKIKSDAGLGATNVSLEVRELKHTNTQNKLEDLLYSVKNGGISISNHDHSFTVVVERVGAVCWTDGYILFKCSLCNETKKEMTGGHDYELVMRTTANCWVGGGDYMQCKRCGNAALINWKPAIGHQFGPPQPTANNVWMIIHCARVGCGHSEYVPVG